jgi:hypothetical protein
MSLLPVIVDWWGNDFTCRRPMDEELFGWWRNDFISSWAVVMDLIEWWR